MKRTVIVTVLFSFLDRVKNDGLWMAHAPSYHEGTMSAGDFPLALAAAAETTADGALGFVRGFEQPALVAPSEHSHP